MIYFDAAYIAKCYLNEPGSPQVARLAASSLTVAACELAKLEVSAAFRRHCAEGRVSLPIFTELVRRFAADEDAGAWEWLPVTSALVQTACQRLQGLPATLSLRTLDALHLTCAKENGFTEVYTNDRHMLLAASHFGLHPINILP
jgi:predicted nucleic acid-binding protein